MESHVRSSKDPQELKGRTVIITGGGQGIGRALAEGIAARGANIAVVDIVAEAASDVALRIETAGVGRVVAIHEGVESRAGCARIVSRTLERFGAVHALINNAGIGMRSIRRDYIDRPVRFWDVDVDKWQALMDVNVRGSFLMAQSVVPHMLAAHWGRIINVTTSLDTMYRAGYTPYGPSKAWLEAATVSWARDLDDTGVTCNALLPGGAVNTALVDTDRFDRAALIQPEAMVPPACWLLSDRSSHITAQRFVARQWDPLDADPAAKAGAPAAWQAIGSQSHWPGGDKVH